MNRWNDPEAENSASAVTCNASADRVVHRMLLTYPVPRLARSPDRLLRVESRP
jgi:hypothetical protein